MKDCLGNEVVIFVSDESGNYDKNDKENWFKTNILNRTSDKIKAVRVYQGMETLKVFQSTTTGIQEIVEARRQIHKFVGWNIVEVN